MCRQYRDGDEWLKLECHFILFSLKITIKRFAPAIDITACAISGAETVYPTGAAHD